MGFDLRRFDVYRKIPKDLTQPTLAGAAVSIISGLFIVTLLFTEFISFISVETKSELFVAKPTSPSEKIKVYLNVTLPRLPCDSLGLDIQDDMGRHEVGFSDNTLKTPVNDGSGCWFEGTFEINKVPGNFHLSTHSAISQPDTIDFSHEVHSLIFGPKLDETANVIGAFDALKGVTSASDQPFVSYDYYMKIVPSVHVKLSGVSTHNYQYTYAAKNYMSLGHGHRVLPAVWFRYDMSPITVKYKEQRPPFYHFITTICAIVGGTFTVAGIIDSIIFTAAEVFRKAELGKLH